MKRYINISLMMAFILAVLMFAGCNQNKTSEPEEVIGIIGAMDVEIESLKEKMDITNTSEEDAMEFCEGTLEGQKVVIVKCGMGKVNAGICAHALINTFACSRVITTGVAGSLDSQLDIGDIVISTDAVQHDFTVEAIGFEKGEIPYTEHYAFPADEQLRAAAMRAVQEVAPTSKVVEGRVCTGDQFISTIEQRETIISNFGGLCCEMEGGAVAQACYLNNTPFVIIRAISDKPNGSNSVDYETFKAEAAAKGAAIVQYMVENM